MIIDVVTPYPLDSTRGNTVSAQRIRSLLQQASYEAHCHCNRDYSPSSSSDLLIALHARKSDRAIQAYLGSDTNGNKKPLVVLLTGSDLHHDISSGGQDSKICLHNMEQADALVLCQSNSANAVPPLYLDKLHVIEKSVSPEFFSAALEPRLSITKPLRLCILAHLRAVKNPQLAAQALRLLPENVDIQIDHYGEVDDQALKIWAEKENLNNPRWNWKGAVPRSNIPKILPHYHLSLNTSDVEGGANSIAESIAAGIPVIASI